MWYTYIPNMRSVQASMLEISCLQVFHSLNPVDPKWPLTSSKNNRLLVVNVVHLHTTYEICLSFPAWDIMFTSRRHGTHTHTHTYIHTRQHDCKGYDYHRNQKDRLWGEGGVWIYQVGSFNPQELFDHWGSFRLHKHNKTEEQYSKLISNREQNVIRNSDIAHTHSTVIQWAQSHLAVILLIKL